MSNQVKPSPRTKVRGFFHSADVEQILHEPAAQPGTLGDLNWP